MNGTQYIMNAGGELEPDAGPRTWDGEPIYCAATVREGLFDASAFAQLRGQTSMVVDGACERCGATGAQAHIARPCECGHGEL